VPSPCSYAVSVTPDPTTNEAADQQGEVAHTSAPTITLQDYEQAERGMAHEGAQVGIPVHGIVTVLVSALSLVPNLSVAQGSPWSAFALAGMAIRFGTGGSATAISTCT
jgi:hypothetical protein